jgi:hypothetical protein
VSSLSLLRLSDPTSEDGLKRGRYTLTDRVSHESRPTFLLFASCRNRSYTDRIRGDAGSVLGRANGALMSAFSEGESFDMLIDLFFRSNLLCLLRDCRFDSNTSKSLSMEHHGG